LKIRVAYDISLLADWFNRPDSKSGIYRVAEEIMFRVSKRDDVELTAMGICGDDVLASSIKSYLYVETFKDHAPCRFDNTFKSRLGLTNLYLKSFSACLSEDLAEGPKSALRTLYYRGVRGILYRLYYTYKLDDIHRVFDQGRFDIFHSPYFKLPPRQLTKHVPRVITLHDLIPINAPEFVPAFYTIAVREILNSIDTERDWVISVSEYTKQEFCARTAMSPDRVFVVPLAASGHFHRVYDASRLAVVRQRYDIPEGDYVLSIGSLEARKNLTHLIRCFSKLLSEHPTLDITLVLVGRKGWAHEKIFSEVESPSSLCSRVMFTGYVPDEDLSALYSGARAFVFPSLYEGFGLPLLEAMQCEVPVIASNTTSIPEVVGDAGILVDPKDVDALCQALLDLLTDNSLSQELKRKGLERAKLFSWDKSAADTVEVYKRIISNQ
jgi:glycosyltransferase involved in cell wall biosynthesis